MLPGLPGFATISDRTAETEVVCMPLTRGKVSLVGTLCTLKSKEITQLWPLVRKMVVVGSRSTCP